jgi:hypothetical protein
VRAELAGRRVNGSKRESQKSFCSCKYVFYLNLIQRNRLNAGFGLAAQVS